MSRYGYGSSFSEQLERELHGRLFCRGDCPRHPDVTRPIADQLRGERQSGTPELRASAELAELLGRQPADIPDGAESLAWGPLIARGYWPDAPGAVPWASLGEVPGLWSSPGWLIEARTSFSGSMMPEPGAPKGTRGYLPTTPATQLEWSVTRAERPCWSCKWGPRRWLRRRHWECRPPAVLDLWPGLDPWGRPWCLCSESGDRHAHMPSGAIVSYRPES